MSHKVVSITKDWWKTERPAEAFVMKKPVKLAEKYMTPTQVAQRMNVSVDVVYDEIKKGRLESERIGKRRRISEQQLIDYLFKNRQAG